MSLNLNRDRLRDFVNLVKNRLYVSAQEENAIVEAFHKLYYSSQAFGKTWADTKWLGTPISKTPQDMWVYQEIIYETAPDLIIETGTNRGGSALYLASICDLIGRGTVVTVDILAPSNPPQHERIRYLTGSSTAPEIISELRRLSEGAKSVMVVLDSDHSQSHVRRELDLYSPFVTAGCYLVVEDTNVNGHPVFPEHGPGPMEALLDFLRTTDSFEIDDSREKFYLTFNPRGYLRRR